MKNKILFLFIVCSVTFFAQSSNLRFYHLSVDNGLSQNHVMDIFQDSKGFIWICTQDGLNRYDGYQFKIFKHIPGDTNSIPDYAVNRICQDNDGKLWIGTREGLVKYDPVFEKFYTYKNNLGNKTSLSSNFITELETDNSGNVWIGTLNGLNLYNKEEDNFIRYFAEPDKEGSISSNRITDIKADKNGNLWIGTTEGLNKFNSTANRFTQFIHNPDDNNSLSENTVLAVAIDGDVVWAGTRNGLNKITITNNRAIFNRYFNNPDDHFSISSNHITSLANQNENYIWVGTSAGLNRLNKKRGNFEVFTNNEFDSKSLNDNFITKMLIDKSLVLWIGTVDHGLNKLNLTGERFIKYSKIPGIKNSLSNSFVQSVIEDKNGTILVGTENGINRIINQGTRSERIEYLTGENLIRNKKIHSVLRDSYGDLWIGTFGGGVSRVDSKTGKTKFYLNDPGDTESLSNNYIHIIYEDSKRNIWIGTGLGGVNKYIRDTDIFISYKKKKNDKNSLIVNEVISITEDKNGFLWFGTTTGGLSKYDPAKDKFASFIHTTTDSNSISSNRIVTLFTDSKGRLWLGTFGGGLNLYKDETESFIHFTEKDGLPGNIVVSITEDNEGNLWMGTNKGISKFNPQQLTFKNYDVNDGLQGNEFSPGAVFKSKISDKIFFGGLNGLTIFNPEDIKDDTTIPEIVITDFKVFNKSVQPGENSFLEKNILFTDNITISFSDNIFSFEFAALHFSNPQKNKFAYVLEGFDKDWIYSGNRNLATYTNLDPGDYIFRVKGSNGDDIWNEEGASVRLYISPPVYRTWWAYIFYAGLIVFIFVAVRRYELNKVRLKNELKLKEFEAKKFQEVDQLKSRFFANISHEFRTPLTIILGSLDKLKMKSTDKLNLKDYEIMKRNAARLLQLINQLLELSKIEAGSAKLQVSKNDLIKFLRRIIASFSSLAYQRKISLYFNGVPSSVEKNNEELFAYFDKEKLETVFYNLLSNAVKFTPPGERIDVDITQTEKDVEITFTNTGVEIPANKLPDIFTRFFQVDDSGTRSFEGTGIGLALVRELIELHKGTIKAESRNLKTSFIINIPLGKSHFSEEEIVEDSVISKEIFQRVPPLIQYTERQSSEIKEQGKPHSDSTIILVVEDNPDLREFIKEHLEDEYSIVEAEDGSKGLTLGVEIIPDLIISDIMMPVMDGYELCREIKTNEKTSHIPFILLTAKAEMKDKLEGLETGADDYLVKPFNPDELKIRVSNLIKIRRQMREKFRTEMLIKPTDVIVPSAQKVFLDKLTKIIEDNLENGSFSLEVLCNEIGMSRAQLHRKVKAITNQTTTEFIRNFRLQRAADLIKQEAGNMAEIAYQVGFNSQAYFNKSFQELFGCSPTEFKERNKAISK